MGAPMERQGIEKKSLWSWPGLLAGAEPAVRRATLTLLALLSAAMVATQTNYFVVGDAHMIAVLAPIAACALLMGPKAATLVGFVAGLAELVHASLLPLDAYEQYFSVPTNSVLLFALIGCVMGLLYAGASRRTYDRRWKGICALVVACLMGSALFTALFTVSANIILSLTSLSIPPEILEEVRGPNQLISQVFANFLLMSLMVVVVAYFWHRRGGKSQEVTLRRKFQGWLFVVVCVAYLICAAGTYTAVSIVCRNGAESQMKGQLDYLAGQLTERDTLLDGIARRTDLAGGRVEELHASSVGSLATGLPLGRGGVTVVAEDGVVVSSSEPSYVGESFEDVVGAGLTGGFDESLYDAPRSTRWYMAGGRLAYMRASELAYVRVARSGSYQMMAALPQAEVYQWRPVIVIVVSGVFLALFAAVYAQASLLLKNVVVKSITDTNSTLELITKGALSQHVSTENVMEFRQLSAGINATVDSLKDAIAAEAARNERDLATAKAIQTSALPSAFPPFPEIDRFDIFASMDAAREVGGDFYDFFLIESESGPSTKLGFLIADVSGKGIPASLFMMAAKTEIANNMQAGMDIAEAMQTANWRLCQGNDADMFVTVWSAVLDFETGELVYVNAGHNPPLLKHGGTWSWVKGKRGFVMGGFDMVRYKAERLTLVPGDQLFLYTDGVNEAFSSTGVQYGDDRLEAFLATHTDLHPRPLVGVMREELREWARGAEQSDDITMLSLEYGVPPEKTASLTLEADLKRLPDAIAFVDAELANRLCPISVQRKLDVALEELFANVCRYAYAGQDEPGKVRIDYVYNTNPSSLTVSITDWGVPFDPVAYLDPSRPKSLDDIDNVGMGLMMAHKSVEDMSYVRDGDANVTAFRKEW